MKTSNKILLGGMATIAFLFLILTIFARVNIVPIEEIKTSGVSITETRDIGAFSQLRVRTPNVKVVISNGPPSCVITGDENIIPLIATEINGNQLVIKHNEEKSFRFTAPVTLTLTNNNWKDLVVNGCDVEVIDTIHADKFELETNGTGKINMRLKTKKLKAKIRGACMVNLEGSADDVDISVWESGQLKGKNFQTQTAEINATGASNVYLSIAKKLNANAAGSGNVIYYGDPEVRKSTGGAARIRQGQN